MRPQNKLQHRILALKPQLSARTENQKEWAIDKCLNKWAATSRKTICCLECGNKWKDQNYIIGSFKSIVCPSCKNKLKFKQFQDVYYHDFDYYGIVTTVEEFQVVRIFLVRKNMKKGKPMHAFDMEVLQHWIDPDGKTTSFSMSVSFGSDGWVYGSELSLRGDLAGDRHGRYGLNPYKIWRDSKVLPILKKYGFKGNFYGIAPQTLLTSLLSDRKAESLLKLKQGEFLKAHLNSGYMLREYENSVKICIRHGYIVRDFKMWYDYMGFLKHFKKDLHSPKYCCPPNLKAAHDRWMKKKTSIDEAIRRKKDQKDFIKRQAEIAKAEVAYKKRCERFFGLCFKEGRLTITVLQNVSEFQQEGTDLKHCVFKSGYYDRKNSLVLSAKVNGKRKETIEVDISNFSIEQVRGFNNKPTAYNSAIIALVKKNMYQISDLLQAKKKVPKEHALESQAAA